MLNLMRMRTRINKLHPLPSIKFAVSPLKLGFYDDILLFFLTFFNAKMYMYIYEKQRR